MVEIRELKFGKLRLVSLPFSGNFVSIGIKIKVFKLIMQSVNSFSITHVLSLDFMSCSAQFLSKLDFFNFWERLPQGSLYAQWPSVWSNTPWKTSSYMGILFCHSR